MIKKYSFLRSDACRIFFSGICGISMYGIAMILHERGYEVCGSDRHPDPEILRELTDNGIKVYREHNAENIRGFDVFVYSAAISQDNPEFIAASDLNADIFTRAGFISGMTKEFGTRIAIAGTHGKSTVCGMCESIFLGCGCDVSALIGAKNADGRAYRAGNSSTVIFEACEYKRSFLNFSPTLGTVLNIERDHTDCYPSIEAEKDAFAVFAERSERAVMNLDDENVRSLRVRGEPFYFSVGDPRADIYAQELTCERGRCSYVGCIRGERSFSVTLSVPGLHNVRNSLASLSNAYLCGLDMEKAAKSVSGFSGMKRRFEYVGECRGASVYDDYAHHPTEIRATLRAAREMGFERICCAFQSHTYSRTAALFDDFLTSFGDADLVIITDIYAARETDDLGVSGERLAAAVPNGVYIRDFSEIVRLLRGIAMPGTAIITLGAGELNRVAAELCTPEECM